MNLHQAQTIAAAVFAYGEKEGLSPLSCAVLDQGGRVVAMLRQDGAAFLTTDISAAKANASLFFQGASRGLEALASDRPSFVATLSDISKGNLAAAAGGMPIYQDGVLIGAVGVSGDSSENDELAAIAGVEAAGLTHRS